MTMGDTVIAIILAFNLLVCLENYSSLRTIRDDIKEIKAIKRFKDSKDKEK